MVIIRRTKDEDHKKTYQERPEDVTVALVLLGAIVSATVTPNRSCLPTAHWTSVKPLVASDLS